MTFFKTPIKIIDQHEEPDSCNPFRPLTIDSERVAIYGVPINTMNLEDTLSLLVDFIHQFRTRKSDRARFIATANVDFVVQSMANLELRRILASADVVTPDGMPIVWLSRLLGVSMQERVAGIDLIRRLIQKAAEENWSVFFLGGDEGVPDETARILSKSFPGLRTAGTYSPPNNLVSQMKCENICAQINDSRADIVLVAFGCPKQEFWIYSNIHRLKIGLICGIGGTFDFITGRTKRAPKWLQKCGGEWLFRLASNPRKLWHRYYNDIIHFAPAALNQLLSQRKPAQTTSFRCEGEKTAPLLTLYGNLVGDNINTLLRTVLDHPRDLVLNIENITAIDARGIAGLLNLWRVLKPYHKRIALTGEGHVTEILHTQGVLGIISHVKSEEEALEFVERRRGRVPGYQLFQTNHHQWRLVLQGEVPPELAADLAWRVPKRMAGTGKNKKLVVDATNLDILDTAMTRALVTLQASLQLRKMELQIIGLTHQDRARADDNGLC